MMRNGKREREEEGGKEYGEDGWQGWDGERRG